MAGETVAVRQDVAASEVNDGEATRLSVNAANELRVSLGTTPAIDIGTVGLQNIAGADINPATSDLQTTMSAKLPATIGQQLEAASMAVVLPAAQVTTLTPPAAITGFALESAGNLASVKTNTDKIPALGQALEAASVPVVLPAAQVTTLTPPAAITGFATSANQVLTNKSLGAGVAPTLDSFTVVAIALAANTANQVLLAAPGANKQIWVYDMLLKCGTAAGSVSIQDEDDAVLTGVMDFADKDGFNHSAGGNFAMPFLTVATNKALEADTVTCSANGVMGYGIVSV